MKSAYIISTGTELIMGTTQDSNSVFLVAQLNLLGFKVVGKITVGDDPAHLRQAFKTAIESADIVISTGGLGPTFDDLTKVIACEIMGCRMVVRSEEEERLRSYFAKRRRTMPDINIIQAMFPPEAVVLDNYKGTAPGMYMQKNAKTVILLPGPPREMQDMYRQEVEPLLKKDFRSHIAKVIRKNIKIFGLGESEVEERLGSLINCPAGLSMALLAVEGEIHICLTAEESGSNNADRLLSDYADQVLARMGKNVFGFDDETLPAKTAGLLLNRGRTLAVAESCTGGLLGKLITDLPGSSRYFWGGVISYSNRAKQLMLGVKEDTLDTHGAVSPETAREMAQGLRKISGTDYALSITGIAGPDGGSAEKPVGLVYVALAHNDGCEVKELRLGLGRDLIRTISAKSALDLIRRQMEYN